MNQKEQVGKTATFEYIKGFLIGKSDQYKSEYIQAAIVMLRMMFEAMPAITAPQPEVSDMDRNSRVCKYAERMTGIYLKNSVGTKCIPEEIEAVKLLIEFECTIRAGERRKAAESAVRFVNENDNEFGEWDDVAFNDLRLAIMGDDRANVSETLDKIPENEEHVVEIPPPASDASNRFIETSVIKESPGPYHHGELAIDWNARTAEITIDGKTTKLVPQPSEVPDFGNIILFIDRKDGVKCLHSKEYEWYEVSIDYIPKVVSMRKNEKGGVTIEARR